MAETSRKLLQSSNTNQNVKNVLLGNIVSMDTNSGLSRVKIQQVAFVKQKSKNSLGLGFGGEPHGQIFYIYIQEVFEPCLNVFRIDNFSV